MPAETTSRIFRFGVFEANEAEQELRKQGVRIKLHSQPFQVLMMLLEKPSELVAREEMRQRLWGEHTFVDFDHGLNTAVNKLREALDDSASRPRYVETVSGKGYRFIAPVTLKLRASEVFEVPVADKNSVSPPALTATASPVAASFKPDPTKQSVNHALETSFGAFLAAPHELPAAPRKLVWSLLVLTQAMYMAFYLGALANLQEIRDIFGDAQLLSPAVLVTLLVTTAVVLIPVRLFIFAAVAFDFQQLPAKFARLFPVLLLLDMLWAFSPFLLVHHISTGLALGMSAALVYMPFAQRSLILMYARGR
jgi:cholera toxin transcriptional activator